MIEALGEDATGLRIVGRIEAAAVIEAVQAGRVGGLSFGFRLREARRGTYRELIAVELVEVSLVRRPLQPGARIVTIDGQ